MDKQVHDPSQNVDRAPRKEKRQGNSEVEREAKRDRHMQENVDATVEDSFPASDPPSWTSGSSVVRDENEQQRSAHAADHPQDRSGATRVAERNRHRSRKGPVGEGNRESAPRRQTPQRNQEGGGEVRIDDRGMSSQRERPGLAERTPEERRPSIDPGQRLENLDEQILAEQDKPHLKPEHTDDRTDLPGRRSVSEGPHQAFPGAPPIEK
jgi:hypothetical protein